MQLRPLPALAGQPASSGALPLPSTAQTFSPSPLCSFPTKPNWLGAALSWTQVHLALSIEGKSSPRSLKVSHGLSGHTRSSPLECSCSRLCPIRLQPQVARRTWASSIVQCLLLERGCDSPHHFLCAQKPRPAQERPGQSVDCFAEAPGYLEAVVPIASSPEWAPEGLHRKSRLRLTGARRRSMHSDIKLVSNKCIKNMWLRPLMHC